MMRILSALLLAIVLLRLVTSHAQSGLAAGEQPAATSRASYLTDASLPTGVQTQATTPFTQSAKLTPSDGVNGGFGFSVAASGDTVVAGAPFHGSSNGSAYVFVKPAPGWTEILTQTATLTATDLTPGSQFGFAVAISADVIVVGAPVNNNRIGAAYLFARPVGGWSGVLTPTAKLIASDGAAGDQLGWSVAINDDTIIVGAVADRIGLNNGQGSAYVFVKPGGGWSGTLTQTAKLIASDGATGDGSGVSTAVSGDTVMVGASTANIGSNTDQGAVYVYVKPGTGWSGTLNQTAKLTASDGAIDDGFGFAVALADNTLLVGAPTNLAAMPVSPGSAYVFVKPGSGWATTSTFAAKLTPADGAEDNGFGFAVTVTDQRAVVGATGDQSRRGAAYLFSKPASGWSETLTHTLKLTATDGLADDGLGWSVASSGGTIIGGAPGDDTGKGAVFVFVSASNLYYLPVIWRNGF